MNSVQIKYSYAASNAQISINGEAISEYSEITFLTNYPFYRISQDIITTLDNEIGDFYKIDFIGAEYQYEVLKNSKRKSVYCQEITFQDVCKHEDGKWYCGYIDDLAEKYNLEPINKMIKLYTIEEAVLSALEPDMIVCGQEEAEIGVYDQLQEISNGNLKNVVLLSGEYSICMEEGRIIYSLPQSALSVFWNYYRWYCVCVSQRERIVRELQYIKLEERDLIGMKAYDSGMPAFYVGNVVSEMEVGIKQKIPFESFPPDHYFLKSREGQIKVIGRTDLEAREKGKDIVEIVDRENKVFWEKEIHVIQHNYAKEIRIVTDIADLDVEDRKRIEILVIPADAEDKGRLKWEIVNPEIIYIGDGGKLIALAPGKTRLRIQGEKVIKEVEIEVRPILKSVYFQSQTIQIRQGDEVIIECNTIPANASTKNLKWSFDNEIIAVCSPSYDGKKCKVQAKKAHFGKGNLRCIDQKTQISAVCNIEVKKLKTSSTMVGFMIASLVLGWCCMPGFTVVSLILGILGMNLTEISSEKNTCKVCIVISILNIIAWIILIMIAIGSELN